MRATKFSKIVLGLVFGLSAACTHSKAEPPAPVQKIDGDTVQVNSSDYVKTAVVSERNYPVTTEFDGRISVPDKDIMSVSSRVSGRLETLNVSVGDRVTRGQSLGVVWSPDLATASQEYEIAKKEGGELLTLTLQKLRALGISPGEVHAGQSSFGLHSGVDGVVLEKKISAGSSLNPGDVIMTIGRSGTLQFIGDLAPEQAVKVKSGMKVIFDEVPTLSAVVDNVSPISDPSTHMVRVRCKFTSALPSDLPQESFLKSRIEMNEIQALVVPSEALIFADGSDQIFVRDEKSKEKNAYRRVKVLVKSRSSKETAIEIPEAKQSKFEIITDGALLANESLEESGQD